MLPWFFIAAYLCCDQGMMASGELVRRDLAKFRHLTAASLVRARAAGAETAARRRRNRRRRFSDRHAFGGSDVRIGHRDRFDQERGIGVRGPGEQLLGWTD